MIKSRFWPDKGIICEKRKIEANGHKIPILILKKEVSIGNAPGVLWIHGGGYATGTKEMVYMGRGESLAKNFGNHAKIWNTRRNHMAWKMYLRKLGKETIPPYAAPARQTDFSGLPPTYTFVGTAEPFYDETLTFIENLKNAGVEASVDIYENMYHAFDMIEPDSDISRKAIREFDKHFKYALDNYFKEQS